MINEVKEQLLDILSGQGYEFVATREEGFGVYYKYHNGTFDVFMAVCNETGNVTVPKLSNMMNFIKDVFSHPQGKLPGYEEVQQVEQVNLLAFIYGTNVDNMRVLLANVENVWAFDCSCGQFVHSDKQPQDFDGLRSKLAFTRKAVHARKINSWKNALTRYAVVIAMIACNAIIYFTLEIIGNTEDGIFMLNHGASYAENVLQDKEYWRLFTCMFLHFGLSHLLNNMVILGCVGTRVEDAIGHWKFLILYLVAGLGGSVLSLIQSVVSGDYAISAGASGAVFGVIGALLWIVIRHKGRYEQLTTRGMLFMIALSLYYGISTAGVDNFAHLGGLISGFMMCMILYRKKN